ncbi:hypothetical protein BH11BAC2_BH11BAC2_23170 [soil metagenome]
MLIRPFKSTQPFTAIFVVVISFAMWLVSWTMHFRVLEANGMPLYDLVLKLLNGMPKEVYALCGFILLSTQAIHLNYLINKHEILYRQSWLPSLMYLFMASLIPSFLWFHPILFVNTILMFALDKVFQLYKNPEPLQLDFDAAFLLSLASLFYPPALLLFILFALSILILRPFSWRDWVVGIMGFVFPFFLAFLYYFMNNELLTFYERVFVSGIKKQIDLQHLFSYQYIVSVIWVIILFIVSILRLQTNYYKNVTKARLIQQLLILLIVLGLVMVVISHDELPYRFSILAMPVSVFLAYYFMSGRKAWFMELSFLVLAGCWVYNYFFA